MSKAAQLRPTIRRGPRAATVVLQSVVLDVLATFDGSMSTRQVYYQCVSRGAVPNNVASYDRVQRLIVTMRREGLIPYDRIVDRTRAKHQRPGWEGTQSILESCAIQYRRNRWTDQDVVVMVACEKQALEGIFAEAVDEYGASLWVLRGFMSLSFAFDWAEEIKHQLNEGKHVEIVYFGDHDPSGLAIEAKAKEQLEELGAVFGWSRGGLLWEDFTPFNLVNIPVKPSDTRARAYMKLFGNRAAELDALPPDELRRRIRHEIERYIDVDSWERLETIENAERESIDLVVKNWDTAVAAAGGVQ